MEKGGTSKMDRKNKKYSCVGKSERRKNNAGPLTRMKLPAEGCSRRNGKGNKVRGIRYQMIEEW